MLTKKDLLMCDRPLDIREVSLELYKAFAEDFFSRISMELIFAEFQKKKSMDNRFKKTKKRITAFACTYNCLRTGTVFYIPSGEVKVQQVYK